MALGCVGCLSSPDASSTVSSRVEGPAVTFRVRANAQNVTAAAAAKAAGKASASAVLGTGCPGVAQSDCFSQPQPVLCVAKHINYFNGIDTSSQGAMQRGSWVTEGQFLAVEVSSYCVC